MIIFIPVRMLSYWNRDLSESNIFIELKNNRGMSLTRMLASFLILSVVCAVVAEKEASTLIFATDADSSLLVNTTSMGTVRGHFNGLGAREWLGIRYAEPPTGALRWAAPVAARAASDGEVVEADFHAPGCPQHCNLPPGTCPLYGTDEDCLFLDVYAPPPKALAAEAPLLPVFVWVHGGAFEQGLGTSALYNGR